MREANTRYVFTPTQDPSDSGRVILRDGSTAELRRAGPTDQRLLQEFFQRLSLESRAQRFFTASFPSPDLIASLCRDDEPCNHATLLVLRKFHGDESAVIATGTFSRRDAHSAEVSFAVDDAFRGKGLGTVLLERLALLAVRHGIRGFWAVTRWDNAAMRDVFQAAGFPVRESSHGSEIEIDLTMIQNAETVARFDVRDRVATVASMRAFFQPNAVAVVGASRDLQSIGYRTLSAVKENGFRGPIYPINPKADQLLDLKVYHSIRDVPQQVDLAIISVPRELVLQIVDVCAAIGVRALVVLTAGFSEVRGDGVDLQRKLLDKVRGYGMRMIGPNCMGILNTDPNVSLNASFAPIFPPMGRVAMSSQSGALGLAILGAAQRLQLGLSTFVSVGNKADVSGNDLLQYWEEDPNTSVILLYLESFGNPRRFARIAQRVSARKPIVAIKSGRAGAGARAAGSHTAALAAKDVAVDALFHQTGVIRADTLEDMFDLAAALANQPLPVGIRVGIITNAGGPGILCADACEMGGLSIPELSAETKARLAEFLPATASTANPVDMIAAPPEHYRRSIETLLTSVDVDAIIVLYIPVGLGDPVAYSAAIHDGIAAARAAGAISKPVLGCWMSDGPITPAALGHQERLPVYAFPETPARVLSRIAEYARWKSKPPSFFPEFEDIHLSAARSICTAAKAAHGPGWLAADEVSKLLLAMRMPVLPGEVARSADEAIQLAQKVGYPVVVKLSLRTLIHKTDLGGVRLNLRDADAVRQAFEQIRTLSCLGKRSEMDGVLVQPMIGGGVEVMVGMTRDPLFGPLIAFGLGGIHLEVLRDVVFRIAPLTERDAAEMIELIRGRRLLDEFRGRSAVDREAVQNVILRLSRLAEELPDIREIDFNPVVAREVGKGCMIVDARIYLD